MARYPRGRDWNSDREPVDIPPEQDAPAEGDKATAPTPPADPGAIAGWKPPGSASQPDAAVPQWPAHDAAVASAPDAAIVSPPAADSPIDGWVDATAPAVPAPRSSSGVVGGLVRRFWILGVIAVIAIGAFVFRDRLSGAATDLRVGDCFDWPTAADTTPVEDVQHRPCSEPHTAEVFLVYDMPDGPFPSQSTFQESVLSRCIPAFAEYTGSTFEAATTLDVYRLEPNAEGWSQGDREIACSILRVDRGPMTGSVKGSNPT